MQCVQTCGAWNLALADLALAEKPMCFVFECSDILSKLLAYTSVADIAGLQHAALSQVVVEGPEQQAPL